MVYRFRAAWGSKSKIPHCRKVSLFVRNDTSCAAATTGRSSHVISTVGRNPLHPAFRSAAWGITLHSNKQLRQSLFFHYEALRAEKPGALVFCQENPDGLAIKYLVNAKMDFSPRFVSDLEPLKNDPSPVWLLTREANAGELRRAGIDTDAATYRDRFDGVPYLAVYRPAPAASPASARPE